MKKCVLVSVGLAAGLLTYAQPSLQNMAETFKKQKQEDLYSLRLTGQSQGSLRFSPSSRMMKSGAKTWLSSALGLRTGKDELRKAPALTSAPKDIEIEKYQQWYQGIKVEHGAISVVSKAAKVEAVQLEFYSLDDSFSTTPKLSEEEALQKATAFVGAAKYAWEGYAGNDPQYKKPSGSLVIVEDYYGKKGKMNLAYKFEIYAEQPFSRSKVYVSAVDGSVLLVDRMVKHLGPDFNHSDVSMRAGVPAAIVANQNNLFANASATAQTRYSGTQPIITDDGSAVAGKPYRLRQVRNGHNITTLDYQRKVQSTTNDNAAIDFTDNDNNWTASERSLNYDDAALDVQLAMQYISDYWRTVHNRFSWDDLGSEMKSYVHVRSVANAGFDNAYWDGSAMYYGDGSYYSTDGSGTIANSYGFKPLTALDVSAHELGHAVCQSTANLVYQREAGGINEGFSDIWAACVENFSGLPKLPFLIGEEIYPSVGALRSMQNPKALGDPDTYGGQYWVRVSLASCPLPGNSNDQCGVHYNSGVLNKWFYLITAGGSGTNDNKDTYAVTGLGFSCTEKIAFLTEQSLTPNADYAAVRQASINAAATLYGACSNEVVQVTNSWFAVGVGASANCLPLIEFGSTNTTVSEGSGLAGNCTSTKTVSVPVKLGAAATQKTDVLFNFGGTAVQGVHYTVASSSLSFAAGESGTKNLDITILDNATAEGNKTIQLSFTINANGGNGAAGTNNQAFTVTISDDDAPTLPIQAGAISTVTLLNESFESVSAGTTFPAGWDASQSYTGGASATNVWAVGTNAGLSGNAAYITNTPAGAVGYAYDPTSTTDRLLRLPVLNTSGLTDIQLRFNYKVGGEAYPLSPSNSNPNYEPALYDFGRVVYDASGSGTTGSFSTLFNTTASDHVALYGNGTTTQTFGTFRLPSSMENKAAVYLGFRWTSDNSAGNGIPLAIDDIVVTGKTQGTSIETTAGQSNSVKVIQGNMDTYIASGGGANLLAKLSTVSESLSCLTATVAEAGSGRTTVNTSSGSYFRTQKVIQLSPAVPNTTATYQATFYYTAADLSAWSSAEIPQLKILKVKDGVDLAGTLTAADVELVTPVFSDNSANGYYSYTGSFTGFSRFMLVSPSFTLPVNLLSFDAQPQKNRVVLSWQTASEQNSKGFDVERSNGGADFAAIGWVKGAGTGNQKKDYSFTDNFAQPNVAYQYRLKQVDMDGHSRYSAIRQAKIVTGNITVAVSPNPAHTTLTVFVAGASRPADVRLVDAKGQAVAVWKEANVRSAFSVDVSRFSRGVYTLIVHLPDGDQTVRVLLQ
ncbi:M4 family metallopeptidase [Flavisolibacter nicotianae]|uniref:M4 family metallopeptidase n=1 Tax=Flavisolibacter nicotianae TaxID=2364882 RepID=UPI000EB34335|nr:M4 family metallopeptidase [Flavisolibacter nicotianae]